MPDFKMQWSVSVYAPQPPGEQHDARKVSRQGWGDTPDEALSNLRENLDKTATAIIEDAAPWREAQAFVAAYEALHAAR